MTPNGTYVDYLTIESLPREVLTLWRVPFLGGTPKRLIDDVHMAVAWSPDARQMAFTRGDFGFEHTSLIVADADGRNERTVARKEGTDLSFFTVRNPGGESARLSWSPDGKVITALGWGFPGKVLTGFTMFVNVSDGVTRADALTPPGVAVWFDNCSLIMAREVRQGIAQLFVLTHPGGQLSRLTNDLNNYSGLSITADGNSLVTARQEDRVDIWIGDGAGTNGRDVQRGAQSTVANGSSLAWTTDRLLFTSSGGAGPALSRLNPESGSVEEVVKDAGAPSITSDGQSIVYVSANAQTLNTLWRADSDGGHATQITGTADWPVLTRDDQSVLYTAMNSGQRRLWSVPISGGTPTQITNVETLTPDVSPDGKSVAFVSVDDQKRSTIVICDLPACTALRRVTPPGLAVGLGVGGRIRWMPDGLGIAYLNVQSQPNLWVQPISGAPPRRLTTFTDGRSVLDVAWSRDGARLAIVRSTTSTDIVLFRGLRKRSPEE